MVIVNVGVANYVFSNVGNQNPHVCKKLKRLRLNAKPGKVLFSFAPVVFLRSFTYQRFAIFFATIGKYGYISGG